VIKNSAYVAVLTVLPHETHISHLRTERALKICIFVFYIRLASITMSPQLEVRVDVFVCVF
jgi:hypothetical protein